jgi:2-polyprenyl-3-methyl-5-hydroxy-6-metoxy-1,4-benzoquinol methylase
MKPASFLLIPCVRRGRGSGHLKRMVALRRCLEADGAQATLLLGSGRSGERGSQEIVQAFSLKAGEWMDGGRSVDQRYDVIVFDGFATSRGSFEKFRRSGFCVGIDEGGPARPEFDYLIDIMPRLKKKDPANLSNALRFLELPERARTFPTEIKKILVSLGGEDSAESGPRIASAILKSDPSRGFEVDLLKGPLASYSEPTPDGVHGMDAQADLKSRLKDYDLVVCIYGLTAYEALACGTAVLLCNPSPYHEALSQAAGFPSLGSGGFDKKKLAGFLSDPQSLAAALRPARERLDAALSEPGAGNGPAGLSSFLRSFDLPALPPERACVACSSEKERAKGSARWRDPARSYFECPACASIRLARVGENPICYDEGYFFEEYRRQYGKTYLEDFPALRRMARSRLDMIQKLSGPLSGKRVLDIGCAYGAFLLEAKEAGCSVFGIDSAPEAVEYLRGALGIEAIQGYFPDDRLADEARRAGFDIVSLWYVAEHLPDLSVALASIRGLLKPGGMLAFSTPSASGVSARFNPDGFFRSSPMDHQSILSPRSSKRVLEEAGFRFRATRSTGHHPERFPFGRRVTAGMKYDMLNAVSRLFALGDTFEAYASNT